MVPVALSVSVMSFCHAVEHGNSFKIRLPVIPIFQWEFVVELIHITKCSLECKVYHIALKGSIYPENYDLCIIFKIFLTVLMYSMHHGPIYSEG